MVHRKPFLFILFLNICFATAAQPSVNPYSNIDYLMRKIPDSSTKTAKGIAQYILQNFTTPVSKTRAAFYWITQNISYDAENMFAINFYADTSDVINKTLQTRKGICMNFAFLFNSIVLQTGVKSYVVEGYTKQSGFVDYIPHAWCASLIDTTWYLFDPTWGSGYILNSKFVKKRNNSYFKTYPEILIRSHMPFDPLWQFLNYPITNQEFYEARTQINPKKQFFSFKDSLAVYENLSNIEKLTTVYSRIERNGVKNALLFDRLQHIKWEIEREKVQTANANNQAIVDNYNDAVNIFNGGVASLNDFINYRNKQFDPQKSENEIRKWLDNCSNDFSKAKSKLDSLHPDDEKLNKSIVQLDKSIDNAVVNLNEQKVFVDKYFKTGKLFRKTLFRKYTWMGIPLN